MGDNSAVVKIRELEDDLMMSNHKIVRLEETLERERTRFNDLTAEKKGLLASSAEMKEALEKATSEIEENRTKIKELAFKLSLKEKDNDELISVVTKFRDEEAIQKSIMSCQVNDLADCKRIISSMEAEVEKYKRDIETRNDTNASLMNEIELFKSALTGNAGGDAGTLQIDNIKLRNRVQTLVRSVDLHMNLLKKSESEKANLTKEFTDYRENSDLNKREVEVHLKTIARGEILAKKMKSDIFRLQKEVRELTVQNEALKTDPANGEALKTMREGMAALARSKQDEMDEKLLEKRRRGSAEETIKALRNRLTFLLEQLEQASGLATAWQEQKHILKAEIGALYKTNTELRSRLNSMQRSFLEKHLAAIKASGDDSFLTALEEGDGFDNLDIDIGDGRVIPTSTEAVVERALFDTICALTSGVRIPMGAQAAAVPQSKIKKDKKLIASAGKYSVTTTSDGVLDIVFEGGPGNQIGQNVDGDELLTSLQIPVFLRFVNDRSDKAISLFTSKISSILNYIRSTTTDMAEQIAEARMKVAKQQSKMLNALSRVERMKDRLLRERLAKQKNALKVVREQLRASDTRFALEKLSNYARKELVVMEKEFEPDLEKQQVFNDILEVANFTAFSSCGSSSLTGPVGALDIRLPEAQIDDETLNGIFSLFQGELPSKVEQSTDGLSQAPVYRLSASFTPYIDRIITLNLRNNKITDLSCQSLSQVVEQSYSLRMLDLRGNHVSNKGASLLFECVKRNSSILFVTQRQGGFMIEGHREITTKKENGAEFGPESSDDPKYPLRIDIRMNRSELDDLEELLDAVDSVPKKTEQQKDDAIVARRMDAAALEMAERKTYNPTTDYQSTTWTSQGLYANMSSKQRPMSASAAIARSSGENDQSRSTKLMSTLPEAVSLRGKRDPQVDANAVGSLLDKHIRQLQHQSNDFIVPIIKPGISGKAPSPFDATAHLMSSGEKKQKTFNVYTTKLENSDFKAKQRAALRIEDMTSAASGGMQGLVEYAIGDKKRMRRPVSAGNARALNGSKSLQPLKSPAETLIPSGNKVSSGLPPAAGATTSGNSTRGKSSAFALLDDLHKLNPAVLF